MYVTVSKSSRRLFILSGLSLAVLLCLLFAPARASTQAGSADAVTITLSVAIAQPITVTVEAGTLVTFLNDTDQARQVESMLLNQQAFLPMIVQLADPDAVADPNAEPPLTTNPPLY